MRQLIAGSAGLLVLFAAPALAQLDDKPVAMERAPFHIPVFQNDYIILLNVNIPPGRNTGYHIHHSDSISVNLMPASQTNQNYGSNEISAPGTGGEGAPGRATFTNVTKDGPRTHRATNVGPTPFHNISFIFKKPGPAGNSVSDRTGVVGFTQIMDNARVRASRAGMACRFGARSGNGGNYADRARLARLYPWRGAGGSHSRQRGQGHGPL